MEADWSYMPVDILVGIAHRLVSVEDIVAFSSVCHSWYSSYIHMKYRWTPGMPWLMLADDTPHNPSHLRKFYDPGRKKCYRMKVPETFICWGSAHGWIVAIDLNFEMFMFNPLSGAQEKLPSAFTLPHPPDPENIEDDPKYLRLECRYLLDKVMLLKVPGINENMVEEFLAVSIGYLNPIAVARPDDLTWIPVTSAHSQCASDVIYWHNALFIIHRDGAIFCVKLYDGIMNQQSLTAQEYLPPPPLPIIEALNPSDRFYLVEWSSSLLIILRHTAHLGREDNPRRYRDPCYASQYFNMFKLNHDTKEWVEIWGDFRKYGKISLFLGTNTSMIAPALEASGCKSNCIYFTDDEWEVWGRPKDLGGHDIGIFNMDDNINTDKDTAIFQELYQGEGKHSAWCCPLWFMPKF